MTPKYFLARLKHTRPCDTTNEWIVEKFIELLDEITIGVAEKFPSAKHSGAFAFEITKWVTCFADFITKDAAEAKKK